MVYDRFVPCMWRAVSRGYVLADDARFVQNGLTYGFDLGFDPARLARRGRVVHRPYTSALDNMAAVATAVWKRVDACKTVFVGEWMNRPHDIPYDDCLCFPCGAVEKNPLYAPGEYRPVSDHTKSGFNAACYGDMYQHVLDSYRQVSRFLRAGCYMLVSDVDGAFPLLPLAPHLWPFLLFLLPLFGCRRRLHLCCHIFADFGTRFAPGAFFIFFVKVVLNMARSEAFLNLCAVVHVDDLALIGECPIEVDEEGTALAEWCERVAGVSFKVIKTRWAATRQLYIGLWWDSDRRSLELEERRLRAYIGLLFEFGSRAVLSLQERQSIAGKMQRAALTLPPGARCLIQCTYGMMSGLRLAWQRRRTTRLERLNFRIFGGLLEENHGRGLFDMSHLPVAPMCMSDASKSRDCTAGGFVSACGRFHWQPYGTSAARKPIDELEGDWFRLALERLGESWRGKRVPFGVDNQAFQFSQIAGRSRAERLMRIVRDTFFLQLKYECYVDMFWLSSEDNYLADLLSRARLEEFWHRVSEPGFWGTSFLHEYQSGFWSTPFYEGVRCYPDTGKPRTLRSPTLTEGTHSCSVNKDGARGGGGGQRSTVHFSRASIWDGLPLECTADLEQVLDNRLGSSSLRSMAAALKIWTAVCALYAFDPVIATDDPFRGGMAAALVLYMVSDTSLVWASIENYVWAWREWMVLQRQGDPISGVMGWDRFMDAVKVLTIVPSEPRRMMPIQDIEKVLRALDLNDFWEVQFGFFILVLLFTFSRSECPCPKTLDSWDSESHWQTKDFRLFTMMERIVLGVRFKKIKQDRRLERPAARPTDDEPGVSGDWCHIGDVPDSIFSIVTWAHRLFAFQVPRTPDSPMFRHRDQVRPMTYSSALEFLHVMQLRVGVSVLPGLHGIRVTGNNLSKNGNGEEMTQFHGGWLSAAGRSRYDRFAVLDVLAIPARMLGRPPPNSGASPAPREVLRYSHLQRTGPGAGDQAQRLLLPADLEGAVLTGRALPPPVVTGGAGARPVESPQAAAPAVHELDSDARGSGVLLPEGYTCVVRSAANPTSSRSRSWKEYFAPDGTKFSSRAAAWRHSLVPVPDIYEVAGVSPVGSASPVSSDKAGPSRVSPELGIAPASVAQRSRRLAVQPSAVAARLSELVARGGAGSRTLAELLG